MLGPTGQEMLLEAQWASKWESAHFSVAEQRAYQLAFEPECYHLASEPEHCHYLLVSWASLWAVLWALQLLE
jgi:hypothetical protein